jgi:glycosyltransferase involved in cell wall biosynthesis
MTYGGLVLTPALERLAIVIPAWQPEEQLVSLALRLAAGGFGAILVVNDGSDERCSALFNGIASMPRVHILRHAVNLGKGRALKTGINYFLSELREMDGLITADADGQHTPLDVVRVAQALAGAGGRVVLGARTFATGVPLRSRFGNGLTRHLFAFLTGARLADTQTGLRGYPRNLLPELLALDGEGYEYEMRVLAHLCASGTAPVEVPIDTVYIDGNRSSHFNPVRDSMRIYSVLLRFYCSALVAAAIDLAGFSIAFALSANLPISIVAGRFSSLVNFAINKKLVFRNRAPVKGALWRYYALASAIAGLSYLLILLLHRLTQCNIFAAKIAVDAMLSLVSFSAQRRFVFRRPPV